MKNLNTLKGLLLSLLLVCVGTVSAHDFEVDGIYYNITDAANKTVAVTYKGESPNYGKYTGDVLIPDTVSYNGITYSVTSIGKSAFNNCYNLVGVVIGNSVTSIGEWAFYICTDLKTVYNFSNLTFSKGSSDNGLIAYYADKVINAPNVFIEGDFIFGKPNGVNTLVGYMGDATELTFTITSLVIEPITASNTSSFDLK